MSDKEKSNENGAELGGEEYVPWEYGQQWSDMNDYGEELYDWYYDDNDDYDDADEDDEDVVPEGMTEEEYDFKKECAYLDNVFCNLTAHTDLMIDGYEDEDYYWLGDRIHLRERMYFRGFHMLRPREQLEMVLFYVVPKADMKVLTKKILDRFGDMSGVLNARLEDFEGLDIPKICKVWLLQVGRLVRRYKKFNREEFKPVFRYCDLMAYVAKLREKRPWPQTCVLYADYNYIIMACDKISDSTYWADPDITRQVIKHAISMQARYAYMVIFCGPDPVELSDIDRQYLVSLAATLKALHIELLDCVIASDVSLFSVVRDGRFDILQREEEWRRTKKSMLYNFTEAKDEI